MAFSSAEIYRTSRSRQFNLTATLDADVGGTVAHGLGQAPDNVELLPLTAEARLSDWIVTAVDATNVTVAKDAAVGSGAAAAQARLTVSLRDNLIR